MRGCGELPGGWVFLHGLGIGKLAIAGRCTAEAGEVRRGRRAQCGRGSDSSFEAHKPQLGGKDRLAALQVKKHLRDRALAQGRA